jgi:hypothetical protein
MKATSVNGFAAVIAVAVVRARRERIANNSRMLAAEGAA